MKIGLAKDFDRNFSTKARSQILWLAGIIVFAFLLIWGGLFVLDYLFGGTKEYFFSEDNEKNFGDSYLIEYVISLMLDPGQIDHLTSGTFHRWSLFFAFIGVITITGITISTITNMIQRRVNLYLNGEVRYQHFCGHKVIIGFGEVAMSIIDQICKSAKFEEKPCDIIVMSNGDSMEIRQSINTLIDKRHEKYIYVYRGRKDSGEDLDSLLIEKADEVFLLGEQDEYNRDATNMEALRKIANTQERLNRRMESICDKKTRWYNLGTFLMKYVKTRRIKAKIKAWDERESKIPVMVLFGYQSTYAVFQVTNLSGEWNKKIDFRPYNFYDNWAKKVLYDKVYTDIDRKNYFYPSIDGAVLNEVSVNGDVIGTYGAGIDYNSNKNVHLVIFGMSNMGVALGVMAAHLCHFPNFIKDRRNKTLITFFSPEADTEMELFRSRYAHFFEIAPSTFSDYIDDDGTPQSQPPLYKNLTDLLDVQFDFVKGRAEQPKVREKISEWANDDTQQLSIAVCLRMPEKNMEIGLYLPDDVYEKGIPVFIRQKSSGALLSLLNKEHIESKDKSGKEPYRKYGNVYPFGMLEDCYDLERNDIKAARWFNYHYLEEKEQGDLKTSVDRGKMWQELDTALQWSNLYFTYSIPFKLHSLKMKETLLLQKKRKIVTRLYDTTEYPRGGEDLEILAKVEQNRWMVEKLLLGYRKLTEAERQSLDNNLDFEQKAQEYKKHLCHPDIRPFEELDERAKGFNRKMSEIIPEVLKQLQKE